MAAHSSTLAWKIPWMEEPGRLQSMGSWRVRQDCDFTFTFHFHALEKEMATHSSVLAWRIPGTVEPGGLPSVGSHRVGHDWSNLAAAAIVWEENLTLALLSKGSVLSWFNIQFSSVTQSCPTLCHPMNCRTPGLPVHHQLPEFTQTHVHRVGDAIQSSHPLLSPSPAPNPSQHWSLIQWVNSLHEVAKVLEFQL